MWDDYLIEERRGHDRLSGRAKSNSDARGMVREARRMGWKRISILRILGVIKVCAYGFKP